MFRPIHPRQGFGPHAETLIPTTLLYADMGLPEITLVYDSRELKFIVCIVVDNRFR